MTEPPTILLADDDAVLASMLGEYLQAEGYQVLLAANGKEALELIASQDIGLMVLDIMMPELDGIETLKRLRSDKQLPVIMLTARGDDLDRILGLELGADDYVAKPCNPRELLARIKAVMRRVNTVPGVDASINFADIMLDPRSREVEVSHVSVRLTQTEFDLLHLLLLSPGQVVSKKEMSLKVLDKPLSQWDRSIDVHISNLRKKLADAAGDTAVDERIRTLRGSGYLYVMPKDR